MESADGNIPDELVSMVVSYSSSGRWCILVCYGSMINILDKKMRSRPGISDIESSNIVPYGAFYDLEHALEAKTYRLVDIHDELNAFFEYDRPDMAWLVSKGYMKE